MVFPTADLTTYFAKMESKRAGAWRLIDGNTHDVSTRDAMVDK